MTTLANENRPQNFTIEGVKFFKKHLDKIRLSSMLTDHPITASEISVFMILHLYTDEMGQIRSLTKDPNVSERKQLCISNIAIEHNLTYETTKKAFDKLISRNLVKEVYTEKGMHYEIVDYATYNAELTNARGEEKSSYFRIPTNLFNEKIFGEIIRQRYHKGPILLLELSQYFTVQIGTNRRYIDDVELVKGERTMSYLKKTLNTTAQRVRNFLSIIHNVFSFVPVEEKLKSPSLGRKGRQRTFVQVCIDKFTFTLNKACFKQNEKTQERKTYARCKKEMAARIKNANIPVKWRDTLDINKSVSRMVKLSSHFLVVDKAHEMLNHTIFKVADTLEDLHKNGELHTIKRLGAFVNKCFSNAFDDYKQSLSESERLDISLEYYETYGEYPSFLSN